MKRAVVYRRRRDGHCGQQQRRPSRRPSTLASFRALRNGIAISLSFCAKDGQRFIRERGFPLEAMEGRAVHCG